MSTPSAARSSKTVSQRQLAANRRNAAKSTGPRTEEGKAASRENAIKHGLAARRIVLPAESIDGYDELRADLVRDWEPVGTQEMMLVDQIAQSYWRILRSRTVETGFMDLEIKVSKHGTKFQGTVSHQDFKGLSIAFVRRPETVWRRLFRFETAAESAYYRSVTKLQQLQRERGRRRAEPPIQRTEAPVERAMAAGSAGVSDFGNGFVAQNAVSVAPGFQNSRLNVAASISKVIGLLFMFLMTALFTLTGTHTQFPDR